MVVDHDPLLIFTAPPPRETALQRVAREEAEREAKRRSDSIDEELRQEKLQQKKKDRNLVKVLLLGQAESGKSTTLKNFRIKYARSAWRKERASWRAVVQLNLIRAVINILDALAANGIQCHQSLISRLVTLRSVESDLQRRLGPGSEEAVDQPTLPSVPLDDDGDALPFRRRRVNEFSVNRWQDFIVENDNPTWSTDANDPTEIIASCREDIKALWTDEEVRTLVSRKRVKLGDTTAFFLDDVDRIATRYYEPSDDDILRSRLRTTGVLEYRLTFGSESPSSFSLVQEFGREWLMYDVGGARTSRHAWIPYFENMHAIIFLAPISAFDEFLSEDPRVNRLHDTFMLFEAIISSKFLKKATIVVFLNKVDVLKRKLKEGAQVGKYIAGYGDKANDVRTVVKYFRDEFKRILKDNSLEQAARPSYLYSTSVIDANATAATLKSVRDGILRENLIESSLV